MGQGNVFIPVCHSTHGDGGGGWLPSMHHRSHDQGDQGLHPLEVCIHGGGLNLRRWGSAFRGRGFCISGWVVGFSSKGLTEDSTTGTRKAGGTHPPGMLSCFKKKFGLMVNDKISCTHFSGSGAYVTRVYTVNDQINPSKKNCIKICVIMS